MLLTYNEEANIGRTLACLGWARRLVVVDSGSTDATLAILQAHPRVQLFSRPFDTHAHQWNHGVDQVATPWAICLDADYQVTPELVAELRQLLSPPNAASLGSIHGLIIPFRYLVYGRPLRQSVYPAKVVMFRPACCRYINDGHTQLVDLRGPSLTLRSPILHDDRKSLSRWFWAQNRYASLEVDKLLRTSPSQLRTVDKLRRLHVLAPFAVLLVCLLPRQGLLDGWRGWFYAFQRMTAELMLSLLLWERRHGQ